MPHPRYAGFLSWFFSSPEEAPAARQVSDFLSKHRLNTDARTTGERFLTDIANTATGGRHCNVEFDRDLGDFSHVLDLGHSDFGDEIRYLHIGQGIATNRKLTIRGGNLRLISFQQPSRRCELSFFDCNIGELQLGHPSQPTPVKVFLVDSVVGRLKVVSGGVHQLKIQGGAVLDFDLPEPGRSNPFMGTVLFDGVFLPRDTNLGLLDGAQPYRNLRFHLRSLQNSQMADLIHAAELSVERKSDSYVNRVFSYLYEALSDFGSSTTLPIVWFFYFLLLSFCLVYAANGAVPSRSDGEYAGWQKQLVRPDATGRGLRAFTLTMQATANPLGLLSQRALVSPRQTWVAVWMSAHGLVSIVIIALFVFAVRRRFKLQV